MKHYRAVKLIFTCVAFIILGLVIGLEHGFHFRNISRLAAVVLSFLVLLYNLVFKKEADQCPHCGKIGVLDGDYCPYCGKTITSANEFDSAKKSNNPKPPWEG